MGKVEAFEIAGLDCWFISHDHLPAHFHVRRPGEWEARVFFLLCTQDNLVLEAKWGTEPSKRQRRAILKAILATRDVLLREWEEKVCR